MLLRHSNHGASFIEVLLALTLGLLIIGGLVSIYGSGSNAFTQLAFHADAQYTARSSMQQIGEDIRRASVVEVQESGTILRIQLPDQQIRYFAGNNQLYRTIIKSNGTSTFPIAENVTQFQVEVNNTLVSINITVNSNDLSYVLSSAFNFRLQEII